MKSFESEVLDDFGRKSAFFFSFFKSNNSFLSSLTFYMYIEGNNYM